MAIALIGIIVVAILTALSTASMALISADRRATAESLARTQMEYVKHSAPYDDVNDPPEYSPDLTAVPDGYYIDIEAVRVDKDEIPDDDDGIQLITVTVSYEIVGGENKMLERQFTLEDYKREVET